MDKLVFVTGHKNPDTDSICSAIAYAELKKKLGVNAVPKRLGDINRETEFVLKHFGVEIPEHLFTVKTQVADLNVDQAFPVSPDISIKTAWHLMKKNNIKTIPVIDDHERLLGIVTLSDITNNYMDALDNNTIASTRTTLRNIAETLNATLICGSQEDFETTGKVVVAAVEPDDLHSFVEPGDIVITGNRLDIQLKALEYGTTCLILTCGGDPSQELIEEARSRNIVLLTTPIDTYTTVRLVNQSIPVGAVMTSQNLISFNIDDFIDDIQDKMLKTRYRSYPIVDDNNRIQGFISRYHLISQRKKNVILVDHNEKSQTVNGIEEAEILEIIDHHRLGDIQTASPIFLRNEPVGSTSTIVANMFFEMGIRPSKSIAGILCSAILSDTLKFKSPTSTYVDRMTAEKLAEIAGIDDMDKYANQMFKEGSSLQGKTLKEIFYQDFKDYTFGKYRIGIGQVFTMDKEKISEMEDSLIAFMKQLCAERGYHLLMLFVTDILDQTSEVLFSGEEKELISLAFNVDLGENSVCLPGIVSRKKQVVPLISVAVDK
ncbi:MULTISPECIES: putative manganese-dependent inorganic diphosphatase [Dehalobacter]|jgi:manganese-dependent inorganic pyrophosphatase|uniref:inorganic diphosphatase n=1 Tax=Dehalobacter restrictus (strain DSM 9455 / PER-K23) TaxID=871738 RepID=A0ABN4BUF5_DEHRP|nr:MULTISPECIES: putative manganese-dependent inorganic diphosphatase [Dehalobacter]AHF11003.1 inorganic pyrophosphatase [Dehalobacter restrictus DSM 9455]MCG1024744.1 putative manganese-dependent inorganic diphosphatase [Dehalobacter sp.]MDJ0307051.1 putative manganese-dependent inorganic diphosphatase [Dehalobacter sp.]OCZ49591.1 inorganic pyrophosphatase [Dehalobacter sp. TeCB1]